MKIVKFLTLVFVSLVVFASCNNEDSGLGQPGIEAGVGYATVYLKNNSSGARSNDSQAGTAEENKIKVLEFYIFNSDGTRDMDDQAAGRYVRIADIVDSNEYTFAVTAGSGKYILVAANMELGSLGNKSMGEVKKEMYDYEIGSKTEASPAGIPMTGESMSITVEPETVKEVDIVISRLYGKISAPTADNATVDITSNEMMAELELLWGGNPLVGNIRFDLKGYVVVNGLKKSFAFPNYGAAGEGGLWDQSVWTIGGDVNNYTASEYVNYELGEVYSGDEFLTSGGVYVYENSPYRTTMNQLTGFDPATVYALIIEADLYDSGNPANTVTRYWRINVSKTGEKESIYKIMRNTIYNVDIRTVKTIGYGTPGEAEEEKPIIPDIDETGITAIISVADWRVFNEGISI